MPRIPDEELERLKREVDLAALVRSRGVELKRHGRDLVGRCPFHEPDETPSFVVTPSKNLFHCLGCGAGGSVIDLVMRADGVSFRHAVELLKEAAEVADGASGPPRELSAPVELDASDSELLGQVVGYYQRTLEGSAEALEYLRRRGIDHPEAIAAFRLGYANRTLGLRLPERKLKAGREVREQLTRIGVLRSSGHEHLAGSLTIPVMDEHGRVTELYGRKIHSNLRPGTARHLYLPGPHRGVWNLDALRASKEIILCESLIDALTFWCAGLRNVTAVYGTSGLTQDIVEALCAYGVERVVLAYDRDDAGHTATRQHAERLAAHDIACFQVRFPAGMDANEYALRVTPADRSLAVLVRGAEQIAGPEQTGSVLSPGGVTPLAARPPSQAPPETHAQQTSSLPSTTRSADPTADSPSSSPSDSPSATPAPPPPALDIDAEVTDTEVIMRFGDRRWRVRGLAKSLSFEQLRVNVLVSRRGAEGFHVDTLDLYAARARAAFIKLAAGELEAEEATVKRDMGRLLLKLEELQEAEIRKATAAEERQVALSEAERAEALSLLEDPRLIERLMEDLERCGVVGEETNKLVAYLASVSRKLPTPLAVVLQSSSAAGKSALMNAVLDLAPEEERVQYSAMTGQSLFYMGTTDLQHKVLAIAEEEGAERASYALKLLQSEGQLSIASTGKDPATGRLVTNTYRVEGPVAIMLTTTAIDVDEELLNRCLVLTVDEEREQTRAIHRLQRERRTPKGLVARAAKERLTRLHRNAQRLLEPLAVANPYAERLTFLDSATRTRRDHEKYLTLIEAVALLHQHQREIKSVTDPYGGEPVSYIEVAPEDVAIANRLADEVLGRSLDELSPQTRRFLELVWQLVQRRCAELEVDQEEYRFSRREVREHTGWSLTQVRVHLERLVEMEYVLVHRGGRGQSFVYELLWRGGGLNGKRFIIGLIEPQGVEAGGSTTGYDSSLTRSGAGVAAEEAEVAGGWRGQDGPKTAPRRARGSNLNLSEMEGSGEGGGIGPRPRSRGEEDQGSSHRTGTSCGAAAQAPLSSSAALAAHAAPSGEPS